MEEGGPETALTMNTVGRLIAGGLAGVAATIPMTLAMKALFTQLPSSERYALPPRLITENLAEAAEVEQDLDDRELEGLSYFNHFAYGGAMGAIYAGTIGREKSSVGRGAAFGLAVWLVSYQVGLPVAGLLTPAHEHPPKRTALMIASHLVWGAALGSILSLVSNDVMVNGRNGSYDTGD